MVEAAASPLPFWVSADRSSQHARHLRTVELNRAYQRQSPDRTDKDKDKEHNQLLNLTAFFPFQASLLSLSLLPSTASFFPAPIPTATAAPWRRQHNNVDPHHQHQ